TPAAARHPPTAVGHPVSGPAAPSLQPPQPRKAPAKSLRDAVAAVSAAVATLTQTRKLQPNRRPQDHARKLLPGPRHRSSLMPQAKATPPKGDGADGGEDGAANREKVVTET